MNESEPQLTPQGRRLRRERRAYRVFMHVLIALFLITVNPTSQWSPPLALLTNHLLPIGIFKEPCMSSEIPKLSVKSKTYCKSAVSPAKRPTSHHA